MLFRLSVLLGIAIALHATPSTAQTVYPACYNIQNVQVHYYPDPSIPDIAVARTSPNGQPIVLWNPSILMPRPAATQEFFYYHECAHHALGHALGAYGPGGERQADCWAKQTMIQVGVMTPQKYQTIRKDLLILSTPGIDWPNGAVRVQLLDAC
ncbi:hypothetical protein [Aestuariivita boseongensis]|uniref:hypothetical protein n=1 Tax=Aestuariivita boseongensis TaxID=1470562 RepID=UPI000681ECBB|nr:hypothetical protein [Aestuariivita boseongensis]